MYSTAPPLQIPLLLKHTCTRTLWWCGRHYSALEGTACLSTVRRFVHRPASKKLCTDATGNRVHASRGLTRPTNSAIADDRNHFNGWRNTAVCTHAACVEKSAPSALGTRGAVNTNITAPAATAPDLHGALAGLALLVPSIVTREWPATCQPADE
eukprot:m.928738 g.928738  ORF g.928738 m.928738 type:complete len:155 (-) comp23779_c1_seq7:1139-1603(-)